MEDITIKEIRTEILKLKQTELANILGITKSSYSLKESGKRNWTIKEVLTISKLANINPYRIKLD